MRLPLILSLQKFTAHWKNILKLWHIIGELLKSAKLIVGDKSYLGIPTHVSRKIVRPIHDYAKSSLEVAEYEMRDPGGDLLLAKGYLEQVATSNAEDVARAVDLLKHVKTLIQNRADADAHRNSMDATSGPAGTA
jgi:hypothetical protein